MSLDKFGRSSRGGGSEIISSLSSLEHRRGFIFTTDGNIDVEKLKLCNVQSPTEEGDGVNKKYVDDNINAVKSDITNTSTHLDTYKKNMDDTKRSIKKLETKVLHMEKLHSEVTSSIQSNISSLSNAVKSIEEHTKHFNEITR